jgi:DNA-binding transcriptional MerR regulator
MADREWFERLDALIGEIREALALNNAALERQDRTVGDLRTFIRDQLTRFDRVIEDRDRQLGARLEEIVREHRTEMTAMIQECNRENRTKMDAIMERHFPSDGPATA